LLPLHRFLDYEISFLRLLDKITNGSVIEISHTGTSVVYRPGVIIGGTIEHDCPNSRAIGYFLEGIVALAPFAKSNLNCLFKGITNDNVDPSVIFFNFLRFLLKFFVG
jgi:RNA 3'-terminal phosphate cyclase-like protein